MGRVSKVPWIVCISVIVLYALVILEIFVLKNKNGKNRDTLSSQQADVMPSQSAQFNERNRVLFEEPVAKGSGNIKLIEDFKEYVNLNPKQNDKQCTQDLRLQQMKKFCQTRGELQWGLADLVKYRESLDHLLVDDRFGLLFCDLDILASTTSMKKRGIPGVENKKLLAKHLAQNGLKYLEEYTDSQVQMMLDTYQKILVVKHPFERLITTWKKKFLVPGSYYKERLGPVIARHIRGNLPKGIKVIEDLHFEEFIHYILLTGNYADPNWLTYEACKPCSLKYDFIKRSTDTHINSNCPLLHDQISLGPRYLLSEEDPQDISKYMPDFQSVSKEQISKLLDLYKFDLSLLGYQFHGQELKAFCSYNDVQCC